LERCHWQGNTPDPFRAGYHPGANVIIYDNMGEESLHCGGSVCRLGIDALRFVQRGRSVYVPMVKRVSW